MESIVHQSNIPCKRCYKCKRCLAATTENFARSNDRKDGLSSGCKDCRKDYDRLRRKQKEPVPEGMRFCPKCSNTFPATTEYFHRDKGRIFGLGGYCKECCKNKSRKHYKDNPSYYRNYVKVHSERCKQHIRAYRKRNATRINTLNLNRRARKKAAPGHHTAADVQSQYERQKGKCYYCRKKVTKYHVDHVVPISRGGSNGPENLVIACPTCNIKKRDKLLHEWIDGGRLI